MFPPSLAEVENCPVVGEIGNSFGEMIWMDLVSTGLSVLGFFCISFYTTVPTSKEKTKQKLLKTSGSQLVWLRRPTVTPLMTGHNPKNVQLLEFS